MEHELATIDLDLAPNEASGLLPVADRPLLAAHGWDEAFWVVLDEGPVEVSVAVVGHAAGAEIDTGWSIERLHAGIEGDKVKTEDAEAVARHDGWVYVFGSQFGKKDGPLQPKRSFVARFREADVRHVVEPPAAPLTVARPSFLLHRLVNDALRDSGIDTVALGPHSHRALIAATRARGRSQVRDDDLPLNVEGAVFRGNGSLLLGLRFPTAADGRPLLVDLDGIQRLFEPDGGLPEVRGFLVLDAVGRDGSMAGVRDMTLHDGELHVVTGNIDAREKGSVLLLDYPEGAHTVATHWRCRLPRGRRSGRLAAERVHEFPDLSAIEGIAVDHQGRIFYVSDEDEGVVVKHTHAQLVVSAEG
ncbi:MAG TPA: hypothetical protein VFC13_26275 [Actinomycetes bacterium]|nr:hypothetical protein [Actinomycetes bacterium]